MMNMMNITPFATDNTKETANNAKDSKTDTNVAMLEIVCLEHACAMLDLKAAAAKLLVSFNIMFQ